MYTAFYSGDIVEEGQENGS